VKSSTTIARYMILNSLRSSVIPFLLGRYDLNQVFTAVPLQGYLLEESSIQQALAAS
jgi:hypothetical protein